MDEKLKEFSRKAGAAALRPRDASAPIAQRHIDRFKELKARLDAEQKPRREVHAA